MTTTTFLPILATARSSIVHGGGAGESNVVMFRRESVIGRHGVLKVPVVSGNAFRGVLRRAGAWMVGTALGWETVPASRTVVRLVSSGGALVKERALPVEVEAAARTLPHLALFGGCWGGKIHEGCLVVDKLVPVCAETAFITGVSSNVRAGSLLDLEQFVRHDSDPWRRSTDDADDETNQMIYQTETLSAGAVLSGGARFRPWATEADVDWFHACLAAWAHGGAAVGGRSATGHGQLTIEPGVIDGARADRAAAHLADAAEAYRGVFAAIL